MVPPTLSQGQTLLRNFLCPNYTLYKRFYYYCKQSSSVHFLLPSMQAMLANKGWKGNISETGLMRLQFTELFGYTTCNPQHVKQKLEKLQRGDTGQKPKHAPFCMKGAATHTSLHQFGPNLASNWCWLYKLPEHVLKLRQVALRTERQD